MKKIVVLVGLGLLMLTLAPLTYAGVASSLLDESCSLKMRDDMVAQSGLPAHGHPGSTVSISDPSHAHYQSGREVAATGGGAPALIDPGFGVGSTVTGSASTGITATTTIASVTAASASASHNNVQPSTVINFIIKH